MLPEFCNNVDLPIPVFEQSTQPCDFVDCLIEIPLILPNFVIHGYKLCFVPAYLLLVLPANNSQITILFLYLNVVGLTFAIVS